MRKTEHSYGIIPLRKERGKWQVLLLKHGKGHWAFPKGHPEIGEDPEQTAVRELKEEAGLSILSFLQMPPQQEHYFFRAGPDLIDKRVTYFAAEVAGQVVLQEGEISDYKWLSLEEAPKLATYAETRALCNTLLEHL
jgi:bis(5'-nucleosidyl)-tetraphosphatase